VRIGQFAECFDIGSENSARRMIINQAIALKELGQLDDMNSLLSKMDWSACGLTFQLALHALKDEDAVLYSLLPKAVAVGEIEKWHLEQWPLFASQRATPQFSEALERAFPTEGGKS
jgi:hypothetical protein